MSGSPQRQKKGLSQFHGRLKKRAEEEKNKTNANKKKDGRNNNNDGDKNNNNISKGGMYDGLNSGIGGNGNSRGEGNNSHLSNMSPAEKNIYYEKQLNNYQDDINALKRLNDELSNQIQHLQNENDSKHSNVIIALRNQLDIEKRKNFSLQSQLEKREKDIKTMAITTTEGDFALQKAQKRIKELENDLKKWMDLESDMLPIDTTNNTTSAKNVGNSVKLNVQDKIKLYENKIKRTSMLKTSTKSGGKVGGGINEEYWTDDSDEDSEDENGNKHKHRSQEEKDLTKTLFPHAGPLRIILVPIEIP